MMTGALNTTLVDSINSLKLKLHSYVTLLCFFSLMFVTVLLKLRLKYFPVDRYIFYHSQEY